MTEIFGAPDCPRCKAVAEALPGGTYHEDAESAIAAHPLRNELQAQLAMQGMALPVVLHNGRVLEESEWMPKLSGNTSS